VNTVRVASYVRTTRLLFNRVFSAKPLPAPAPSVRHDCYFVGADSPVSTAFYNLADLALGAAIEGPAVVISSSSTFLVEPGWTLQIGDYGAGLFTRAA
jgi:N-methylhydantoinase A